MQECSPVKSFYKKKLTCDCWTASRLSFARKSAGENVRNIASAIFEGRAEKISVFSQRIFEQKRDCPHSSDCQHADRYELSP